MKKGLTKKNERTWTISSFSIIIGLVELEWSTSPAGWIIFFFFLNTKCPTFQHSVFTSIGHYSNFNLLWLPYLPIQGLERFRTKKSVMSPGCGICVSGNNRQVENNFRR